MQFKIALIFGVLSAATACKTTAPQSELSETEARPAGPVSANQVVEVKSNDELSSLLETNPNRNFLVVFSMGKETCPGCRIAHKDMATIAPELRPDHKTVLVYYEIHRDGEMVDKNIWQLDRSFPQMQVRNRRGLIKKLNRLVLDQLRKVVRE